MSIVRLLLNESNKLWRKEKMSLHRNIRRALARFEKAVGMKVFKGTYPPEEHADIDREYRKSKERLVEILQRVPDELITSRCKDAEVHTPSVSPNRHRKQLRSGQENLD
jgi:hypothetical protein